MPKFDAVVAGHICLDMIPGLGELPSGQLMRLMVPGRLINVSSMTFSTGGAVSNTGIALSKLGLKTHLIGKIGSDPLAATVKAVVDRHAPGQGKSLVVDKSLPTSYTVILSAPGLDRIFLHCSGANEGFSPADIQDALLKETRLVHLGYPPLLRRMYLDGGKELRDIAERVQRAGATMSLDMSLPDHASESGKVDWLAILSQVLPHVDVFVPSFEELLFCLRRKVYEDLRQEAGGADILGLATPDLISGLARQVIEMGVKMALIKLGDGGVYLRTAGVNSIGGMGRAAPADPAVWSNRQLRAACFQVDVVGTTGAGDATIAGFLAGLLNGQKPEDALISAVGVGACNVEAADALSGLRSWQETQERISSGWEHRPLDLNDAGWTELQPGLWEKQR